MNHVDITKLASYLQKIDKMLDSTTIKLDEARDLLDNATGEAGFVVNTTRAHLGEENLPFFDVPAYHGKGSGEMRSLLTRYRNLLEFVVRTVGSSYNSHTNGREGLDPYLDWTTGSTSVYGLASIYHAADALYRKHLPKKDPEPIKRTDPFAEVLSRLARIEHMLESAIVRLDEIDRFVKP